MQCRARGLASRRNTKHSMKSMRYGYLSRWHDELGNAGDDLGRSNVQHMPLWKGEYEQASLAKVFDDPAMRPKPMGREPINKPQYSLMSSDIWGAKVGDVAGISRPPWRHGPCAWGVTCRMQIRGWSSHLPPRPTFAVKPQERSGEAP